MPISREILQDLCSHLLGELPPDQAAKVNALLTRDPHAAAALQKLKGLLDTLPACDAVDPPRIVKDRAKDLMGAPAPTLGASLEDAATRAASFVARLILDSFASPQLGLRGGGSTRMLLFTSDIIELDLQVESSLDEVSGTHAVMGQIEFLDAPPSQVHVIVESSAPTDRLEIVTDDAGLFRLGLRAGVYSLRCLLPDGRETRIPEVVIP